MDADGRGKGLIDLGTGTLGKVGNGWNSRWLDVRQTSSRELSTPHLQSVAGGWLGRVAPVFTCQRANPVPLSSSSETFKTSRR